MASRVRKFEEQNYVAVFTDGKTYRFAIDPAKPILSLPYPEFYDVKITDKCNGGCPYCYMDSLPGSKHAADAISKVADYFGHGMTLNERPFQVAIGGGEPTEHPLFKEILNEFVRWGIMPNYTTNGMSMTPALAEWSVKNAGGIAVSTHPHLDGYWRAATKMLVEAGAKTNLHVLISDKESVDAVFGVGGSFWYLCNNIEHVVLLPYHAQGRAEEVEIASDYLWKSIDKIVKAGDFVDRIAFGAGFYDDLVARKIDWASIYDEGSFSGFLDLADMKLYKSSFDLTERIV